MHSLNKKLNYKGFTLVELIVVISILAILATIAFLSFSGYSSKARDGSRIADTMSLSKGLELYQVKSGYYPKPEGILTEGIINGTLVAYKGEIQDQISSLTKISKTPKDPLSNNYYIYGTTLDYKQYQIATTLENSIAYNKINPITQTIYADGPTYQAKVTGNYKGLIKYTPVGSTQTWITNIPSLIYNSGTELLNTGTIYSIDKSTNLPYKIQNATTGNKDANTILKEITNNNSATLTGMSLSGITSSTIYNTSSGTLKNLGFDLSAIEKVVVNGNTVVGQSGSVIISTTYSCIGTLVLANSNITNNTNLTSNTNYQTTNSANNCYYSCKSGFSGTNCEIVLPTECTTGMTEITLPNGQTWSCMNLGASTVRNGSTSTINTSNWAGNYYQWGRNDTGWTKGISAYNYGWEPQNDGKWGGSTLDSFTVDGQTNKILRQGPCPTNRHVPSAKDWQDLCNQVTGITCTNGMPYNSAILSVLKLPLSGYRSQDTGGFLFNAPFYWTSSPKSNGAYNLYYSSVGEIYFNQNDRSFGMSVRCLKN